MPLGSRRSRAITSKPTVSGAHPSDGASGNVPSQDLGREVFTVDELASLLRVNRKTLYSAIKRNEVPGALRVGRCLRFCRKTVIAWLAAGQGLASRS